MEKIGNTEFAASQLKKGIPLAQVLKESRSVSIGDYLYRFLSKTDRSVETIAGLAGLNKSSLYRILNAETTPQRNVLLRLSRILSMDFPETQMLLKIGKHATLSGSNPRDIIIMEGIIKNLDIMDISSNLARMGHTDLFAKK